MDISAKLKELTEKFTSNTETITKLKAENKEISSKVERLERLKANFKDIIGDDEPFKQEDEKG